MLEFLGSLVPAFMQDAWNLLPWLSLMQKDPGFRYPGATGSLLIGEDGLILREPAWAEIRRGRPAPAELPDPN